MSQAAVSEAVSSLTDTSEVPPAPLTALALQSWTLVRLAHAGLLEPIARALPTYITGTERDEMRASLATLDRYNGVRRDLTELRELVADRLDSGSWTTLPSAPSTDARRISDHVLLSLAEIIDSASAQATTNVWIEDRAMSRTRMPLLLSITDIADHLLQKGIMDARQYWDLDRRLREMGVVFMPIPVSQIASDVLAAPVVDGVLVETPELSKWRRWYAQSVDHLALSNQAPEPDQDGRIAGEPRYLLDMMATARNVLAAIWSDMSKGDDDKRARSDWVWTCLRFETSPALPWSNANDETRRNLMSTVLMHTADLPLMARLDTDRLPSEAHHPFIDWFVQAVLHNRCTVDPALGDAFARRLASLIAPQLDPELNGLDDSASRDYMAQVYRRYLELFPESWRDRIMSHFDLAA